MRINRSAYTPPTRDWTKGTTTTVQKEPEIAPSVRGKLPFPIRLLAEDTKMDEIEESTVLIIAQNGFFLKRTPIFGTHVGPTPKLTTLGKVLDSKGSALLPDKARLLHDFPPLQYDDFRRVEQFFAKVWELHKSEALVLLIMNPVTKEMKPIHPKKQTVSHASINFDHWTPKEIREVHGQDWRLCGSIHSHADFGASQSGVDSTDEHTLFDGLHITIGDNDKPNRTYHVRITVGETQYDNDLRIDQFVAWPDAPEGDCPEDWLNSVEKEVYQGRGIVGVQGSRYYSGFDDEEQWDGYGNWGKNLPAKQQEFPMRGTGGSSLEDKVLVTGDGFDAFTLSDLKLEIAQTPLLVRKDFSDEQLERVKTLLGTPIDDMVDELVAAITETEEGKELAFVFEDYFVHIQNLNGVVTVSPEPPFDGCIGTHTLDMAHIPAEFYEDAMVTFVTSFMDGMLILLGDVAFI